MNRRFEEKLISFAFGELSPEDSASVQRTVDTDPAAAKKVVEYRNMRRDLAGLSATPQTQVSVEQMRDAILRQGLKQGPRLAPYGWAFGASLAALLGLGFIVNRPGMDVPVAQADPAAQAPVMFAFDVPTISPLRHETELTDVAKAAKHEYSFGTTSNAAKESNVSVAVTPNDQPSYVVHESTLPDSVPADAVAYNVQPSDPPVVEADSQPAQVDAVSQDTSLQANQQNADSPGDAVELPGPQDQTIVIMKDDKDKATGARTATEVGSSSDVVVGG